MARASADDRSRWGARVGRPRRASLEQRASGSGRGGSRRGDPVDRLGVDEFPIPAGSPGRGQGRPAHRAGRSVTANGVKHAGARLDLVAGCGAPAGVRLSEAIHTVTVARVVHRSGAVRSRNWHRRGIQVRMSEKPATEVRDPAELTLLIAASHLNRVERGNWPEVGKVARRRTSRQGGSSA